MRSAHDTGTAAKSTLQCWTEAHCSAGQPKLIAVLLTASSASNTKVVLSVIRVSSCHSSTHGEPHRTSTDNMAARGGRRSGGDNTATVVAMGRAVIYHLFSTGVFSAVISLWCEFANVAWLIVSSAHLISNATSSCSTNLTPIVGSLSIKMPMGSNSKSSNVSYCCEKNLEGSG